MADPEFTATQQRLFNRLHPDSHRRELREFLHALRAAGWSLRQMARRFDKRHATIVAWMRQE